MRSMMLRSTSSYMYFLISAILFPDKRFLLVFNKSYRCFIIITANENWQQAIIDRGWYGGGRNTWLPVNQGKERKINGLALIL